MYDAELVSYSFSIGIIFFSIMQFHGSNYLIPIGKEKELMQITTACSIIGLILVLLLTHKYSYLGATYGVLLTWVLRAAFTYKASVKNGGSKILNN